jgi:hypothetical protein
MQFSDLALSRDAVRPLTDAELAGCFEGIFRGGDSAEILDPGPREQKDRLFGYKEEVWTTFGYSRSYLEAMKSQSFWDGEFEKIQRVDAAMLRSRGLIQSNFREQGA